MTEARLLVAVKSDESALALVDVVIDKFVGCRVERGPEAVGCLLGGVTPVVPALKLGALLAPSNASKY